MESLQPFPVTRIANIQTHPTENPWLVDSLWAEQAVGFIGGTPKSAKTWLALELAFAVASGRPCLDRYQVRKKGHVLFYAAEDTAHAIKDRVLAIASARGVDDISRLPIGLICEDALRLDNAQHQQRLAATVQKLKPRLLILDPLVRLHRSDENSSADVGLLLHYLRQLQRQSAAAVLLVHHIRKNAAAQPGQALRGSGDLHAWSDSNLYLLRRKGNLWLHAEHRTLPAPEPVAVDLTAEPHPHLSVVDNAEQDAQDRPDLLGDRIVATLANSPMTRTDLRAALGVRNERLGQVLTGLEAAGHICRQDGRLAVPVPNP